MTVAAPMSLASHLNENGGENRYKFQSFTQRIKGIKILIKKPTIDDEPDATCFFLQGLQHWTQLNCTSGFSSFYGSVNGYATLEQVLHHKESITQSFIEHLKPDHGGSLEPLLDLASLLAKDLQDQFDTLTILGRIAALINTEQDPVNLEYLYNSVALLFKSQSKFITVEDVFGIFKHQLYDSKTHIRTFAAECLAFLIRKHNIDYRFIIADLATKECQEYCEGQALLFFEIIKQVNNTLHSKAPGIYEKLLSITLLEDSATRISFTMFNQLNTLIGHHAEAASLAPLWKSLLSHLTISKDPLTCGQLLQVICIYSTVNQGKKILDRKVLLKAIEEVLPMLLDSTCDFAMQELIKLLCSILETSSLEAALVYSKKTLDLLFASKNHQTHTIAFIQILRARHWTHFPKLIIPRTLRLVQSNYVSNTTQYLIFLSSVLSEFQQIMDVVPIHLKTSNLLNLVVTLDDGSSSPLFDLIISEIQFTGDWVVQANMIIQSVTSEDLVCKVVAACTCLEFLYSDELQLFDAIKPLFTSVVGAIDVTDSPTATILRMVGGRLLQLLTRRLGYPRLESIIDDVLGFLKVAGNDSNALEAIADFCAASKGKSLDATFIQSLEILVPSIGSIRKSTRLATLRILDAFSPLPLTTGKPCLILSHCHEIEEIEDCLDNVRGKNIILRKLTALQTSTTVPVQLKTVALRYLLALLSSNFMPLVTQVTECVKLCGEFDIKTFWDIYSDFLRGITSGTTASSLENGIAAPILDSSDIPSLKRKSNFKSTLSLNDIAMLKLSNRSTFAYTASENFMSWIRQKVMLCCVFEVSIDIPSFYINLLRSLSKMPHMIEQRSPFLIPIFLELFEAKVECGDIVLSVPVSPTSSLFSTSDQRKQILEFLDMISKVRKPQNLHLAEDVKSVLMYLLPNGDSIMQEKTFKGILAFKNSGVIDNQDSLLGLLDDERFRDALSCVSIAEFEKVKPDAREEFIGVLCRILYGKAINRKGRGSAKAGLKARRAAIFAFISTLHDDYQNEFFGIMTRPFMGGLVTDPRVQIGFLNVLESFLRQFKFRAFPFMDRVLGILMRLLGEVEARVVEADGGDDFTKEDDVEVDAEGDENSTAPFKTIRQLIIKRLVQIFHLDLDFDFAPFVKQIFSIYITPRIDKLAVENTQASSGLMELFFAWAHNRSYVLYLSGATNLIPNILNILSAKKVKEAVTSRVLEIVESIVNIDQEDTPSENMEGVVYSINAISTLLIPYIDCLLVNLKNVLIESGSAANGHIRLNSSSSVPNRILHIIARLASHLKNSSHLGQLVDMMLPFLKKPTGQVAEVTKSEILGILSEYLSTFEKGRDYNKYFVVLSQLFSSFETRKARNALVSTFNQFSAIDAELVGVCSLLADLNAYSIKRLDEPNFELRFTALKAISGSESCLPPRHWLPIVHNLIFNMHDLEEYSVRTAAVNGLLKLVSTAAKETATSDDSRASTYIDIVIYTVFPGIKKGLKFNSEIVRKEFVEVLCTLVTKLPNHPALSDMTTLLAEGDDEANFFSNIYHPQVHRREKALRRLSKDCPILAPGNINTIFIPIASHFIFESDLAARHQLVNEAVNALSACAGSLPWGQYHGLIKRYFGVLNKKPYLEHIVIRVVVAVLDKFHFEVNASQACDSTPMQIGDESAEKEEIDDDDNTDASELLAVKIHTIVVEKIIPELHKHLAKKEDEALIVRVPVALAITKLLQQLPEDTLVDQLPKLVLTLCNILKSRQQSARDTTREILVKISISLGMKYFPFIVKQLFGVLTKGYQLHVLGYTIHSLLIGMVPTIEKNSVELDLCIELLVQIFISDIFGEVGDEREVQELNGKMREIKKTKSFDSFELVARAMSMSSTLLLLSPLKELMLETTNSKITHKIDMVLKHISLGINANSSVQVKDLMIFIRELVTENLDLSKMGEGKGSKKSMLERNFSVQVRRPNSIEPLKYFQANAYRFVEFGFSLLLAEFKRGALQLSNEVHQSMIIPLVGILGSSLYSKHSSVVALVIRNLAHVVKLENLSTIKEALPIIVKRLLEIVTMSVNTGTDLVQTTFRLLTTIIRDCKSVTFTQTQLTTLLNLIKPDLEEPERQSVSFSLIRAILSRKYEVIIMYDLMDDIAKILVTSQSAQVRELCRLSYIQFLLEYPQGPQRLQKQWNHIIKNLQYEFESGRESIMELLNIILDKFPESIIFEYSEIIFVSLVVNLVNDDSSKCRQMTGLLLKKLMGKNGLDRTGEKMMVLANAWSLRYENPEMLRTAAQVFGLAFEAFGQSSPRKWISSVFSSLIPVLNLVKEEMDANADEVDVDSSLFRYWEAGYYSLSTIGKLLQNSSLLSSEQERLQSIFNLLSDFMMHPHQWIRSMSGRVLGMVFSLIDPKSLLTVSGGLDTFERVIGINGRMYSLALRSGLSLQSQHITSEVATQIVKNLFFLSKSMYLNKTCDSIPSKNDNDEVDDNDDVHNEAADSGLLKAQKTGWFWFVPLSAKFPQTVAVFQYFAALVNFIPIADVQSYLGPIMATLYRASNDEMSRGPEATEVRNLSNEVLDLIKERLGTNEFLELYNVVRGNVVSLRNDRKQKRAIDVIVNPERSIKRKIQKNLNKRVTRKRKNEEFSRKRGSKMNISKKLKR